MHHLIARIIRSVALPTLLVVFAFVCVRPAQGQEPDLKLQMGSPIHVSLQGQPLHDHDLEFSTDLQKWQPVLSLRLPASPFDWIDPTPGTRPRGFYRLVQWPDQRFQDLAPNFQLIDHYGRTRDLYYNTHVQAVVLIFSNGDCDSAFASTVADLQNSYAAQSVLFWMIDSVSAQRSNLVARAAAWGLTMPILYDEAQIVARAYGAQQSPEAVAIDTATWAVFYRGAIDSRADGQLPTQTYLKTALDAFLAGQPFTFQRTPVAGCPQPLVPANPVSYRDQIAPLLIQYCVTCHSEGNIAPFAMTNYQAVRAKVNKIRETILANEMPPWFADPSWGHFTNNWSLSPQLARSLVDWIDQGAPQGTGSDPLAEFYANTPPPTNYPVAWPAELGEPDLVIGIPNQSIPASGEVNYRYPEVHPNIPTNAWLRAAIIRPGNRRVVHHALVFLGTYFETLGQGAGLRGFFAGYVPGLRPYSYPAGTGKFIQANPTFTFQMHYQTIGTAETDQTLLGLYFQSTPPALEYKTTAASTTTINLLPGAREYSREASTLLSSTQATFLYELSPHMHYRGWRMEFEAMYPGGATEKLLAVPRYNFDWQLVYRLETPKMLPAGTSIRCRGAFDNSAQNPLNPDPSATVKFGEQTDDEMFIGYINYAVQR